MLTPSPGAWPQALLVLGVRKGHVISLKGWKSHKPKDPWPVQGDLVETLYAYGQAASTVTDPYGVCRRIYCTGETAHLPAEPGAWQVCPFCPPPLKAAYTRLQLLEAPEPQHPLSSPTARVTLCQQKTPRCPTQTLPPEPLATSWPL